MYRFVVLCVLAAVVTVAVAAGDSLTVDNYVRRARSPYTYGEDGQHGSHGHGHGGAGSQEQSSHSAGQSNFEPVHASDSSSGRKTQPLLGQDGHGQQGYQGHGQGHGSDNYLYKKHGY